MVSSSNLPNPATIQLWLGTVATASCVAALPESQITFCPVLVLRHNTSESSADAGVIADSIAASDTAAHLVPGMRMTSLLPPWQGAVAQLADRATRHKPGRLRPQLQGLPHLLVCTLQCVSRHESCEARRLTRMGQPCSDLLLLRTSHNSVRSCRRAPAAMRLRVQTLMQATHRRNRRSAWTMTTRPSCARCCCSHCRPDSARVRAGRRREAPLARCLTRAIAAGIS